ncbi:MAG: DUF1552 domain-containing protein [Phycisphaera sp.]|nr:DUF1552 domain-containing protein [Phycisphaera sp.]
MNSRRSFLKASMLGAGVCAFGPSFDALGAGAGGNSFPKRFVFMRVGNGVWPEKLSLPTFSDDLKEKDANKQALEVDLGKHELPDYLTCLNDHKEHMAILQGMSSRMSPNGHHSYQGVMGLFKTNEGAVSTLKRASIDYELAKLFPSPLGHVELSFASERKGIVDGWSVPAPYQKNFCYADPITAYNNLFQCVLDPESLKLDIEMFDHIRKTEIREVASVRGADKLAQENHVRTLDSIRKRNDELLKMSGKIASLMPDREMVYANGHDGAFSVDRQRAMAEILASILVTGLTNVVTYTIDNLDFHQTGLPGLEQSRIHNHTIGHGESVQGVDAGEIRKRVRVHHFNLMKTIVDRLKAHPEGSGTMFDNTMVMYFPEGGEKHHGNGIESPWVVMAGKNCNLDIVGRYVRFPALGTEGHQTLGNWYTSLLNAHGNPIKHYGDLDPTMTRMKLPQEGAIKRFLRA